MGSQPLGAAHPRLSSTPAAPARRGDAAAWRPVPGGSTQVLRAGATARFDDRSGQFAIVVNGATKLVARAAADREQIVGFQFPGDIVPLPTRAPHSYALVALRDSTICFLPEADVLALARKQSPAIAGMLEGVVASLQRCREKTIALGRKTAPERVAGFLVSIAGRLGASAKGECALQLPMSRRDIADSLGLTIETVSRQFTDLRAAGLIETRGRAGVRILDLPALARRAGHLGPSG